MARGTAVCKECCPSCHTPSLFSRDLHPFLVLCVAHVAHVLCSPSAHYVALLPHQRSFRYTSVSLPSSFSSFRHPSVIFPSSFRLCAGIFVAHHGLRPDTDDVENRGEREVHGSACLRQHGLK